MLTFDVPADSSGVTARAPAAFTEADVDREAIRERFGRVFAAVAPEWLPEHRARQLSYLVDELDAAGWLRITVTRVSTGELLAATRWHFSAVVRPDWTPPTPPPHHPGPNDRDW